MHRSVFLTLLAASAVAGAAQAAPFTCPAHHQGKALDSVTVFDGPPEEMASLRRDGREVKRRSRQSWDVAYAYKQGREIHVQCHYLGGGAQVVKPPKTTRTCSQDLLRLDDKGHYRTLSFSCR